MDLQVDCAPCRRWMFGNGLEGGGAVGVGSNVDPHSACAEDGGLLSVPSLSPLTDAFAMAIHARDAA